MTQVAHLDGPFVVDLHKGGPIIGQGGAPEEATPIGVIPNQNDNGNAAFDPTTSYGFGFSTVQATYDAYNVNLDPGEAADFAYMVQKGYSVFYAAPRRGTATPRPTPRARRPTRAPGRTPACSRPPTEQRS